MRKIPNKNIKKEKKMEDTVKSVVIETDHGSYQ